MELTERVRTKASEEAILKRAKAKTRPVKTVKGLKSLAGRIENIRTEVERYLGDKRDEFLLITEESQLREYVQSCVKNGIASIDTETTGLNPLECGIVGFSLYTPGEKPCYVPINHYNYITEERAENQLTEKVVKPYMDILAQKVRLVFFNAPFDVRVIRHTIGTYITPYFDTSIASRLLNENEPDKRLKPLYKKYILHGQGDAFSFADLFSPEDFPMVPVETAYLYATNDALVTYELYLFQLPFLMKESEICQRSELQGVANIFWKLEMPLVTVVCDIEDRGVKINFEYARTLSEEYHKEMEDVETRWSAELKKYTDTEYSISSPMQLAKLFYDELGVLEPVFDKKDNKWKRPTGEEVLSNLNHPLCPIILEYRNCRKLLSTYVDKMPELARKDGRVHGNFNQVGTDTGRFSSSNPNLQNIPSHNTRVRKMFTASDGFVMIGADFSAQEPRMTAHMCNDQRMIQAYRDGKDLYCEIASIAFKVPYEECKEFRPDGSTNREGKERRSRAKAIVLGICYGKGVKAIGEDLHISKAEAQNIYDTVLEEFPGLRHFMDSSIAMAHQKGYVTTLFGRKRRLPEIQLPRYEFSMRNGMKLSENAKRNISRNLDKMWFEDKRNYIEQLKHDGIYVKDNGGYIARAERQCVNARIQGGAGDQIKVAMNRIANDPELNELDFHILLQIHDELIGECPEENAQKAGKRFKYLMEHCMDGVLKVPSKCDVTYSYCWYGDEINFEEE